MEEQKAKVGEEHRESMASVQLDHIISSRTRRCSHLKVASRLDSYIEYHKSAFSQLLQYLVF